MNKDNEVLILGNIVVILIETFRNEKKQPLDSPDNGHRSGMIIFIR